MSHPSISVVIPTYNRAHLVTRAIRSAQSETSEGDEIIVVDDGSTDATSEVVAELGDKKIRYLRQDNRGAGAARNLGVEAATGDLIAFLDSDDVWLPGKTIVQRTFMNHCPDVLFSFTNFNNVYAGKEHPQALRHWNGDDQPWEKILDGPRPYSHFAPLMSGAADFPVYTGSLYRREMHFNYIATHTLMVRRNEAGGALRFNTETRTFEDWECWGRLSRHGKAAFLDFDSAMQQEHPGPRLTDADLLTCANSRLVVLKNVWGADPEFMAAHGAEYDALVRTLRMNRVRGLLSIGEISEARADLATLPNAPLSYRALASLPSGIVTGLVALRRAVLDNVVLFASTRKTRFS